MSSNSKSTTEFGLLLKNITCDNYGVAQTDEECAERAGYCARAEVEPLYLSRRIAKPEITFKDCPFCADNKIEAQRHSNWSASAVCTNCSARGPRMAVKPSHEDAEVEDIVKGAWNQYWDAAQMHLDKGYNVNE